MNKKNLLEKLEQCLEIKFPDDYRAFILEYDGYQNYQHKKIKGKFWNLASLTKEKGFYLLDMEFCCQLKVSSKNIRDFTKKEYTVVTGKYETFPLEQLEKCIVIGYENGDYLFLKPDDFSVWVYWHDGDDCQKLESSFSEMIKNSKEEFEELPKMQTESRYLKYFDQFVGIWKEDIDDPLIMELRNDSTAQEFFSDGSGGLGHWRVINKNTIGKLLVSPGYKPQERKMTVKHISENELILYSKKHDYEESFLRVDKNEFKNLAK